MKTISNLRFISLAKSRAILLALSFCAASAPAAQLIWDPLLNGGTISGSSNWDTTAGNAIWWNGTSDVVWSQTATNTATQGAIFNGPDAAAGTYVVTLDATIVAATNLVINNSGYAFSGNPLFFPSAASASSGNSVGVAANKSVTFNCGMAGAANGNGFWILGSGATMNVAGKIATSGVGQQLRMLGASGSTYNLSGFNSLAIPYVLAPSVNMTGGSLATSGNFFIGYNQTINGTVYNTGTLTVSGGTVSENGGIFIIARGAGTGTLIIQNGGTVDVGTTKAEPLAINYDGNALNVATVDVQGGILQVDSSSFFGSKILFFDSGAAASNSTAVLTQEGGAINAWGGIVFGTAGGAVGSSATLTQTGGALNVGPSGITEGAYSGTLSITLSGGTVGDLSSPGWSSSLPMTLGTTNGNVSFNPGNTITLSGALTGAGGLNVTSGTLALSGANNYGGSTGVSSSGTLAVATGNSPISSGAVTVDGALGTPTLTVNGTPGDSWSIGGGLAFQNNTPTLNFQFGTLPPNPSVAPVQVTGNVAFTATPSVIIGGSGIAKGTYPLITYTGSLTGTLPTSVTTWQGGSASAGIIFNSGKTIYLQVTASSINAPLYWQAGNGVWNFASPNWTQSSAPADYSDGDAVIFDNSATGTGPFTVTLNTAVNPGSVTFNNTSKSYTITNTGSGSITGSGVLSLLGSGTNTLAGANTYNGGTVLSAGQLNINNGGSGSASAIGTGTLTLNSGASLDNTSGSDITLQPSIPEVWNGNFTYAGSANNFNTGAGGVTLSNNVSLDVNAMDFTVGGAVFDNFTGYQVTKTGNGALTLAGNNNFGGVTLASGQLNLGSATAAGTVLTINASGGCKIDNSSGGPLTLSSLNYVWTTGFEFLGSANLDFGTGTITGNTDPLPPSVQVDGSAVMSTEGQLNFGNVSIYKYGTGTWNIGGTVGNSVSLFAEAGEVDLNKSLAQSVNGHLGLNVFNGALVKDSGVGTNYDYQVHSDTPGSPQTVTLQGGIWDLNGHNENVDEIAMSAGGTLRNGATNATSLLTLISGFPITLGDTNCHFDVETSTGILNIKGVITGGGSLVKDGLGVLNLKGNQTYSGSTTVNNGTVGLPGISSLSNTVAIILATNTSAVDVSSNTDISSNSTPVLALLSGQTLSGFGTVTGLVQTASGSTLAPGSASAIGTLTVTGVAGTNTLGGTTMMKLDKGNHTNDQLSASGSLAYGGTLALTNLSGTLANGDSFVLFPAGGYGGSFASITPASPGAGLSWNTANLNVSGTLAVMTGSAPSSPRITGVSLSGTTLMLRGTNGPAGQQYMVLESANVALALHSWTPVYTNNFDGSGNFNVSFSVTNTMRAFFAITTP